MLSEWIRAGLDIILIAIIAGGLVQATRLIRHLAGLRQGRIEMERFVYEFNATVIRAEAGIKGLRTAARDSGDDLEKLVEKAVAVRDELHFIVESADKIAERLSKQATTAARGELKVPELKAEPKAEAKQAATPAPAQNAGGPTLFPAQKNDAPAATPAPASRAEKELLQALKKLN